MNRDQVKDCKHLRLERHTGGFSPKCEISWASEGQRGTRPIREEASAAGRGSAGTSPRGAARRAQGVSRDGSTPCHYKSGLPRGRRPWEREGALPY
jgi:hypothetical protein